MLKFLRLFFNTLTADDKYSLFNKDILQQPIEIQLSTKQKTFCLLFSEFLKCSSNFQHFFKKDDPQSLCISDITDSKRSGYANV